MGPAPCDQRAGFENGAQQHQDADRERPVGGLTHQCRQVQQNDEQEQRQPSQSKCWCGKGPEAASTPFFLRVDDEHSNLGHRQQQDYCGVTEGYIRC